MLVRDTYSLIAKNFGFAKFYVWNIAADIFISGQQILSLMGTILGILADFVVGATLGVCVGILIDWTGRTHYWLKGMGIGLLSWFGFFGLFARNLPAMLETAPKEPLSSISAYLGHSIFGIVVAWIYVKLAGTTETEAQSKKGANTKSKRGPKRESTLLTLSRWYKPVWYRPIRKPKKLHAFRIQELKVRRLMPISPHCLKRRRHSQT